MRDEEVATGRRDVVKIITDTLSGLSPEWAAQHGIPLIPQVIVFGDESFLEIDEISIDEFLRRLKAAKELPRTAAPPPGLFIEAFHRLEADKNTIICIHPTADMSGTVRSAQIAKAESYPDADIRIIDTRTIGAQLGTLVKMAVEWAEAGQDADRIVAGIEALIPRVRTHFVVATLEYLQRGGRIGGAAAIVGQLLQVKPILTVRDGRTEALARERTKKRAMARFRELVMEEIDPDMSPAVVIMHCEAETEASELAAYFRAELGRDDVEVTHLVPAIVTHAGPGTIGVCFFAKDVNG
jgi:DegV family protein with EDD domain